MIITILMLIMLMLILMEQNKVTLHHLQLNPQKKLRFQSLFVKTDWVCHIWFNF